MGFIAVFTHSFLNRRRKCQYTAQPLLCSFSIRKHKAAVGDGMNIQSDTMETETNSF